MTLEELLLHVGADVLDDRTALVEGAPDEIWGREFLVRMFNDAQKEFARRTWNLIDAETESVCQIDLVAAQRDYTLHSKILRVLSVVPADSELELHRMAHQWMQPRIADPSPDYWDVNVQYVDQPGRPRFFSTDHANKTLRLRPVPRAQDVSDIGTLHLRVARLPLEDLSLTDLSAEPEIDEQWHLALCDYVAYRALTNPNLDEGSRRAARADAAIFLGQWQKTLREAKNALLVENATQPRFRYGGWVA